MPPKEKYSDPKLRDEVKEEIHNSDKGGAPGQWSARKAQMMASEYKKRGGDYNTDKSEQDESQKNLSKWGEEEWQTKDGEGTAKQEDGTEKRYLPKKAWENMTEQEKEETEQKKQEGSKAGKQHVGNTSKAKESRKEANGEEDEKYESKKDQEKKQKQQNGSKNQGSKNQEDEAEAEAEAEDEDDEEAEYQDDGEADEGGPDEGEQLDGEDGETEGDEDDSKNAKAGQKRKQGQQIGSNKVQKSNNGGKSKQPQQKGDSKSSGKSNGETVGSKHQSAEEPAPKGSSDRLPKQGQKVQWKSLPGFVEGEVVEIVTEEMEVDGKQVKGSEKDPRIVLKSSSSGKIAVHKPDACYYD